jgi:hypothetical protein
MLAPLEWSLVRWNFVRSYIRTFCPSRRRQQVGWMHLLAVSITQCSPVNPYSYSIEASSSKFVQSSPFTRRPAPSYQKTALSFHDIGWSYSLSHKSLVSFLILVFIVPIYDGRKVKTDFTDTLKILQQLPHFPGDVPAESCVVVGHTINTFKRSDDLLKSISLNVQWVIVLGVSH